MILENMPSPGPFVNSIQLQKNAAQAISQCETMMDLSPETDKVEYLYNFFKDCAKALEPLRARQAAAKKEKSK